MMNTDHVYTSPTRFTPPPASHTLLYASALSNRLSPACTVFVAAPPMDTTGTATASTTTCVLALAHAPRKLHSFKVTVFTLPTGKEPAGTCIGGLMLKWLFRYLVTSHLVAENEWLLHGRPQPPDDADTSTVYTSHGPIVAGAASTTVGATGAAGAATAAVCVGAAGHPLHSGTFVCTMHAARSKPLCSVTGLPTPKAPATIVTWFGATHEHVDVSADANWKSCEHFHVASVVGAWSVFALKLASTEVPSLLNCTPVIDGGDGAVPKPSTATTLGDGMMIWYRAASVPVTLGTTASVPPSPLVLVQSCVMATEYASAEPDDEMWTLAGTIAGLLMTWTPFLLVYVNVVPNEMLMSDGGARLTTTDMAAGTDVCEYTAAVASDTVIGRKPPDVNAVCVFLTASAMLMRRPELLTV